MPLNIKFDFSQEGQEKLLNEIIALEDELVVLSKTMMNLPIEEVLKRQIELRLSYKGLEETAMSVNQVNKDAGKILADLLNGIERQTKELNNLVLSQQAASKTLVDFQRELKANNSIIDSTTKSIEQWRVGNYTGKKSIEELTGILIDAKTRYSELTETIKIQMVEIEKEIGYYANLKAAVKELTEERDLLIISEGKESDQVLELTSVINKYNLELQINNRELNGLNTANSLLQKNEEAVVRVLNQDAEATAKLIIVKKEFQAETERQIALATEGLTKEEEKIIAVQAAREKMFDQAWADGEKYQQLELRKQKIADQTFEKEEERMAMINAAREKLFDQAWAEGEKHLQQKARQLEKEQLLVINWMNKQQAIRLKEIEIEEAAEAKSARLTLENELKKAEARNKGAEQAEGASKKVIWSLENISETANRMGLRTLISFTYWTLLIGAATALYEAWTKISDAEQLAQDRLKDYFESFKSHQRDMIDDIPKTSANIEFNKDKGDRLVKDINRYFKDGDLDKAYNKYKELLGLFPKIFDAMDIKKFKEDEENGRFKKQIDNMKIYNEYLEERSMLEKQSKNAIEDRNLNADRQDLIKGEIIKSIRSGGDDMAMFLNEYEKQTGKKALGNAFTVDYEKFLKSIPDEEIIKTMQNRTKSYSKEKSFFQANGQPNLGISADANTEILNQLQVENIQNKFKANDTKEKLDKLQPKISDLEGNEKEGRGHHLKAHPDKIREEKDLHELVLALMKEDYDKTKQSLNDKIKLYENEDKETEMHYKIQKGFIEDFNKISGESKDKQTERILANEKEKTQEQNRRNEERQRDIADFKRYEDEKLRLINEVQDKLLKASEDFQRRVLEAQKSQNKRDIDLKQTKSFNPFTAFFGGSGGQSKQKDYEDKVSELQGNIETSKGEVNISKSAFDRANEKFSQSSAKVRVDQMTDDKSKSPEQLISSKQNLDQFRKDESELSSTKAQFENATFKHKEDLDILEKAKAQKKKEDKIAIAHATFAATEKIANSEFELQKRRIQQSMAALESLSQYEINLAGNNSAAKLKIARRTHGEMLALKRKEAEAEKQQAIFSAFVSMGQGIASSYEQGGIAGAILAAIVVGADLLAIANIQSQPLPSYKKGRKGGRREIALVNEEGFELGEKNGRVRVLGDGKPGIVSLDEGESVKTHSESKDIFFKHLLKGTGVFVQRDNIARNERVNAYREGLSKADMQSVMNEAVSRIPKTEITLPAADVQDRHIRQQLRMGL